jgi:phenylacetate-CoA ligase
MKGVLNAPAPRPEILDRLLTTFRRAVESVPAYRALLDEHGTQIDLVVDFASFTTLCPLLSKANTFDRFPLGQLTSGGALRDAADVLTSSGHGGRFSFGIASREEVSAGASFIDAALDAAFGVMSRPTLVINCLPMGVAFSSHCATVATTSVREDMAIGLVRAFGDHYDQIILVADPLFMKRLTDYAAESAVDWRRYRVHAVLGEEIFGEHFRGYVARSLGLDPDRPASGYVMSSFGVAELGLHLCFETQATIALRRAAAADPAFARDLFGVETGSGATLPMLFTFNTRRSLIEVVAPDRASYGRLTVSMLDPGRAVPLLRYQTGDIARSLERDHVIDAARRHGVQLGEELPLALLALQGRDKDTLPNGAHVGFYKDALYADHECARMLSGAVRVICAGSQCTVHVQLVKGQAPHAALEEGLLRAMTLDAPPVRLMLWPYAEFPFGMSLDYERKFSHYLPGEPAVERP